MSAPQGNAHLALLLAAAAKQTAAAAPGAGKPRGRSRREANDSGAAGLTAHMMAALPPLLRKFAADPQTVSSVIMDRCI